MHIERIWVGNPGRNFNYLVVCRATNQALLVDPFDAAQCLDVAAKHGWRIVQVLNTHEHGDHTAGNAGVLAATAGSLLGPLGHRLAHGDVVAVGTAVRLRVLETPGHTLAHICLLSEGDAAAFLCGDTLFNAGVGNCHNGGDPERLYETFERVLAPLADATRVYPGHEYLARNLAFALDREPGNRRAAALMEQTRNEVPQHMPVTTLGIEREINPFLRLSEPEVVAGVRKAHPGLAAQPSPRQIFLALRALRDRW